MLIMFDQINFLLNKIDNTIKCCESVAKVYFLKIFLLIVLCLIFPDLFSQKLALRCQTNNHISGCTFVHLNNFIQCCKFQ